MGGAKAFRGKSRQFTRYLYTSMSPIVAANGVTGRMIAKKDKNPYDSHHDLPAFNRECDVYFYPNSDGTARQAKVYKNCEMTKDFDWDHSHKNPDGRTFQKGVVHVQEYTKKQVLDKKTGKTKTVNIRSKYARLMTQDEIEKYGALLKKFNPNIKFR